MKKSFKVGGKIVQYDLRYNFIEVNFIKLFMHTLETVCNATLWEKITTMPKNKVGVSDILKLLNDDEWRGRYFMDFVTENLFKHGYMPHFMYLIFSCQELSSIRQISIHQMISRFTVFYQLYDLSVFQLIEKRYKKIKVCKKECEMRDTLSAVIRRASIAEQRARATFLALSKFSSGQCIDEFYEKQFNWEDSSIAELRWNWLVYDRPYWFICSEGELVNIANDKDYNPSDKLIRKIVNFGIKNKTLASAITKYDDEIYKKCWDYIPKISFWLEKNEIIGPSNSDGTHDFLIRSIDEFDKKFE